MAWPSTFYVATASQGVYWTQDFTPSGAQPTWAAINDGLPSLELRQFQADPFDLEGRQYVLLADKSAIYERYMGAPWVSFLTAADANTIAGTSGLVLWWFDFDPTIEGRIWVWLGHASSGAQLALYSSDGGASWTATAPWFTGFINQGGGIIGRGDNVWVMDAVHSGFPAYVEYSSNRGVSWSFVGLGGNAWAAPLFWTSAEPTSVYTSRNGGGNLGRVTNAGVLTGLSASGPSSMWFDPDDAAHMRLVRVVTNIVNRIEVTTDGWDNYSTAGDTSPLLAGRIATWYGQGLDEIVVSLRAGCNPGNNHHWVGVMNSEDDLTPVGRSGDNAGIAPYTGAIPCTAGGVVGIQAIIAFPSEGPAPPPGSTITPPDKPGGPPSVPVTLGGDVLTQAVTMPDYDGIYRGEPVQGDRGAWDDVEYPDRHARDISDGTHEHHMDPTDPRASQAEFLDHSARHETGGADEIDVTDLGGLLGDAQTPIDHDHSGTESGDGGTFDAANLGSGKAANGQVLTADGAGAVTWENPTSGNGGGGDDLDARRLIWMGW